MFMNLIAMTGAGAVKGMALRMLFGVAMVSVKLWACACRWESDVRGVGAGADGLGYDAEGEVAGQRSDLPLHARE